MILTIDAGNTNIVFAVYKGREQKGIWRIETVRESTASELSAAFLPVFKGSGMQIEDVDHVIISSVVPQIDKAFSDFVTDTFSIKANFVTAEKLKDKIDIKLDSPNEIGADRLVNAMAVCQNYKTPAVVVDFGTATTFDVIGAKCSYEGGIIAPGINLSMEALERAASKLPEVNVAKPDSVIGKNTQHAMQSGIYWGYIGLIEGTLKRIEAEMDAKPFIIATGGLAPLFAEGTDVIDEIDKGLTLKGLLEIHYAK